MDNPDTVLNHDMLSHLVNKLHEKPNSTRYYVYYAERGKAGASRRGAFDPRTFADAVTSED